MTLFAEKCEYNKNDIMDYYCYYWVIILSFHHKYPKTLIYDISFFLATGHFS